MRWRYIAPAVMRGRAGTSHRSMIVLQFYLTHLSAGLLRASYAPLSLASRLAEAGIQDAIARHSNQPICDSVLSLVGL